MNPARSPDQGEVLKLGPPATGEVIIAVDPSAGATPFAAGTQTLRPGAEIPVQRHLDRDAALFVHKGQGRATLNGRSILVLPGAMWSVPRGAWHGVRNTGTGDLQIVWVSSPGLEVFFRELSRAGAAPTSSGQVLQELALRYGIEFRQAAEAKGIHTERSAGTERVPADAPAPAPRRRRGRRGGRRHRGGRTPAPANSSGSVAIPPTARMEASSATRVASGADPVSSTSPHALAVPRAPGGQRRRRRPGSVAGPRPTPPAAPQQPRAQAGAAPSVPPPASTSGSSRPSAGRQPPPRGRHQRRVREVYMSGQWVRVEGEGPVIAPGSSWARRRGPKRGGDGEPPGVPLSVPL